MLSTLSLIAVLGALGTTLAFAAPAAHAGPKPCPPGLAKKNNGCLPPGQAKKRYQVGQPLPSGVSFVPVTAANLPDPQPGQIYVEVDGDLLLMAEATRKVIEAVLLVDAATRN
jgi:hypothetical protein